MPVVRAPMSPVRRWLRSTTALRSAGWAFKKKPDTAMSTAAATATAIALVPDVVGCRMPVPRGTRAPGVAWGTGDVMILRPFWGGLRCRIGW